MINNVVLVGRMTRDADLRYSQSNTAVARFTLAVQRNRKNANGERDTDFISCVMFGQFAENLSNWAKKGSLIGVTGRIQTGSYDNQQGQRVYTTDVVCENFQMLESRATRERGNADGFSNFGQPDPYSAVPSQPSYSQPQAPQQSQPSQEMPDFSRNETPFTKMDVTDDDLPF